MSVRFMTAMALGTGLIGAAAGSPSEMPSAAITTLKCVYRVLASNSEITSVEAYTVDGFRFALEYRFRGKDGHQEVSDLMISGANYSYPILHNESREVIGQEMDLAMKIRDRLKSDCHVSPAFDNMLPAPKERAEWQPLDLPDHSP
jgi:hypothetical protein